MSTVLSLPSIESDVTTSSPDLTEFSSGEDTTTTETLTSSQSPTSLPTATSSEHDLGTEASTQLPVTSSESSQSTTHVSHMSPCRTDEEFKRAACLNGGECFAVDAGEGQKRNVACR